MAYKEIVPSVWEYEKDGDFVEGVLLIVKHDVGPNKSLLYNIETSQGVKSVWGSAVLDEKMALVRLGDRVKITYKGKGEAKKGKNAPKIFKVEVDRK